MVVPMLLEIDFTGAAGCDVEDTNCMSLISRKVTFAGAASKGNLAGVTDLRTRGGSGPGNPQEIQQNCAESRMSEPIGRTYGRPWMRMADTGRRFMALDW